MAISFKFLFRGTLSMCAALVTACASVAPPAAVVTGTATYRHSDRAIRIPLPAMTAEEPTGQRGRHGSIR